MKIISSQRTCKTKQLVRELIPDWAKPKSILLNLGDSSINEREYSGYKIINRVENIRNCSNKIRMFEIFNENGIKAVTYVPIRRSDYGNLNLMRFKMKFRGKELVFRRGKELKVIPIEQVSVRDMNYYDFATIKEDKEKEYRIIIYKDKIVRAMIKINETGDFQFKQENCRFVTMDFSKFPQSVKDNLFKAVKVLGIDLCGIDLLKNTDGEFKILEINSGMSLSERSIEEFFNLLKEEVRNNSL